MSDPRAVSGAFPFNPLSLAEVWAAEACTAAADAALAELYTADWADGLAPEQIKAVREVVHRAFLRYRQAELLHERKSR